MLGWVEGIFWLLYEYFWREVSIGTVGSVFVNKNGVKICFFLHTLKIKFYSYFFKIFESLFDVRFLCHFKLFV